MKSTVQPTGKEPTAPIFGADGWTDNPALLGFGPISQQRLDELIASGYVETNGNGFYRVVGG